MPEGPEIKRLSDAISDVIGGQEVLEVEIAAKAFKRYEDKLVGKKVSEVEPRGKATLIRFDGEYNVFTHLKLYGRWVFVKKGEALDTTRQVKFGIKTANGGVYLCSSPDVVVLHDEDVELHPYLAKLGPDVLDERGVDEAVVLARLDAPAWSRKAVGKLLLEQGFLAGIGNYLRSEILFVTGLRPEFKVRDLDASQREALAKACLSIPRRSYHGQGVTTLEAYVEQQRALGKERADYRFHVYKREGLPCLTCQTTIKEGTYGGRRYFYCPSCQGEE